MAFGNRATRRVQLVTLAGLELMLASCSEEKKAEAPEPVRPVKVTEITGPDHGRVLVYSGSVKARTEMNLGFRVAGKITERLVDVGDRVTPDTVLARLDPTDLELAVRQAEADLAASRKEAEISDLAFRRAQSLNAKNITSQSDLEQASLSRDKAAATLESASSALDQARNQAAYTELKSDRGGIVTAVSADRGQVVSAGQKVVTLARPDIKDAVIDLPAGLAERLPADVMFLVAGQLDPSVHTTAVVREIEPQAQSATRTRRARLSLAETPPAFRLGTAISVTLSTAIAPRIELPLSALQEVDGKTRIWLLDTQSQTVQPREVTVISRDAHSALLNGSVKPGERIVTAGVNSLKSGQKVKIDEDSPR